MHEFEQAQRPEFLTMVESLGWFYMILLPAMPAMAAVSFLCVVFLLAKGKGPMAAVAILLFVHAPLLVGLFATIQGLTKSFEIIGMIPRAPSSGVLAVAIGHPLQAMKVAILLTVPTYALAAIWTFVRGIRGSIEPAKVE